MSNPGSSWKAPLAFAFAVTMVFLVGCDGTPGSKGGQTGGSGEGKATLLRMDFGRLVDVYAYRRIDQSKPDRRDILNRKPTLIAENVVVSALIESQPLFDAIGEERRDADYRFMPFDARVGHEELLILWDDTAAEERERFTLATQLASNNLEELPPAWRDQNTNTRPIPVIPRNAAIVMTFDRPLGLSDEFFWANPSALQLLEFKADPKKVPAYRAFRPVTRRIIVQGRKLVIDTTLIGDEARNGQTSTGLPMSVDNVTANLRLALPTSGVVARQLGIAADRVPELNGVDSRGDQAVIRDFRSGNKADGKLGALTDVELPMLVGDFEMGIIDIDMKERVLTLNKRYAPVPVRGRIPFVNGGIGIRGLPGGPGKVPTEVPLRAGDLLVQDVTMGSEVVRVRAEILMNMDVGNVIGDKNFPSLGLAKDGSDGSSATTVRVKVSNLTAKDARGNDVPFQMSSLPLGEDCVLRARYYHYVPYASAFGNSVVTDAGRIKDFTVFDPEPPVLDPSRRPIPRGTLIDPTAAVSFRFSEPMDMESVEPLNNYFIANSTFTDSNVMAMLKEDKPSGLSIIGSRLVDQERDGTLLRLVPMLGLFHEKSQVETYWMHMTLGKGGVLDLAGNPVDPYDRRLNAILAISTRFTLDAAADDNLVATRIHRFEVSDEDGTPPGSIDFFGQFQLRDGSLMGAETTRFSKIADAQTLAGILRYEKGECYFPGSLGPPPIPAGTVAPGVAEPPGVLYWTPSNVPVFPPTNTPFGGIVEPHNKRGSRLQMTYREDDFGLGYRDPSTQMIDLEQMHWAPWNNDAVLYDVFDRYTLRVGHCDSRPDLLFTLNVPPPPATQPTCNLDCGSLFSGLQPTFASNILQGSSATTLLEDKAYKVNPRDAFRGSTGTTFVPYPQFLDTYTWRDSRLISWDMKEDKAIGLGGAKNPGGQFPNGDTTANVSSPWLPEPPPPTGWTGTVWTMDEGDFRGTRARDHDPIAMPMLFDFMVYPDASTTSANLFHIAYVGPIWSYTGSFPNNPGGYYNGAPARGQNGAPICSSYDWPAFRSHHSGGVDGGAQEYFVDPANQHTSKASWIKDTGLGNPYQTKPEDDHLHWAQADFVRKVSMVTFGFFDTLKPNAHGLTQQNYPSAWPGLPNSKGFPDFEALGSRRGGKTYLVESIQAHLDPPTQPPGTSVSLEFRGARTFERAENIYDQRSNDKMSERGNLLNANYACEAYRYAMPNAGPANDTPRVKAEGLTPYVFEEKLDSIRDTSTKLLPRYFNYRLVFGNNTSVTPAISPSIRSVIVAYKMTASN